MTDRVRLVTWDKADQSSQSFVFDYDNTMEFITFNNWLGRTKQRVVFASYDPKWTNHVSDNPPGQDPMAGMTWDEKTNLDLTGQWPSRIV